MSDPYGRSLDAFLQTLLSNGYNINGQWTLESIDNSTSAPSTPAFVNYWTLNLATGQKPDANDVVAVGTNFAVTNNPTLLGSVLAGPTVNGVHPIYPTTVPSSPITIGPSLVLASDNTLGSFSPYEGRIYVAFVGYYNVIVDGFQNPASNTDIFLSYSDDGGRSWSSRPRSTTTMRKPTGTPARTAIRDWDRSTAAASTCRKLPSIRRPARWSSPGAMPAMMPRTPGSRPTWPPASTAG